MVWVLSSTCEFEAVSTGEYRFPASDSDKKACSACISTSQGVRLQKLFYGCAKRENPASTRQLQSNAYPVTQTEDINVALVIQDNIINAVPVVQPVPSLVITHDPEEEELAWMENSLVGVISEGVNYKDIRKGLLSNGVQLAGFRFMGASQALISFNKHKYPTLNVSEIFNTQ
ncbi:hypothetical protein NC652_008135 [Populus alba x Populus x berolinensis]|nr:hypothetical protein NC652_008135 [Populus alba x Populus x berolinensis]